MVYPEDGGGFREEGASSAIKDGVVKGKMGS